MSNSQAHSLLERSLQLLERMADRIDALDAADAPELTTDNYHLIDELRAYLEN